ncbi:MAG: hypothetical protein JW779_12010, partial [Candidatus Thorarchaeota archaeon]|nr:hypothetical protein [Candidatus Thorarchaeota archaeon]
VSISWSITGRNSMNLSEPGYLEILGISPASRNYQILRAILEVTEETGSTPTFLQIEDKINNNKNEPFSKQWIYKCLSDLEKQGMIMIDRINKPTRYSASLLDIRTGLQKIRDGQLKEMEKRKKELQEKKKEVEKENIYDLAYHLVDFLSGKKPERRSGVIEGKENIRRFILLEICNQAKPGDVLRANCRANFVDIDKGVVPIERLLLETMNNGAKVRALLGHGSLEDTYEHTDLRDVFHSEHEIFRTAILNESIDIRAPVEGVMPFRIIALNNDKMFMFLSDSAQPDTVALVFREGNPVLVDNAIQRFDEMFDRGQRLNEVVLREIGNDL